MVNYRRPLGNEFLDITPKAQSMKKNFIIWTLLKLETSALKYTIKGTKR